MNPAFISKAGLLPIYPETSSTNNSRNQDLEKLSTLQKAKGETIGPSLKTPLQAIDGQYLLNRKLDDSSLILSSDESIALLSECIRLGKIESQKAVGKNIIAFIGNTQAGKSTLVNYLYGCEMEGKTAKELGINGLPGKFPIVKRKSQEVMKIGHTKKSMTFMPQIVTDQLNFTYCDCPGFLDNRGFEINIANAVNIKQTFANSKSVRIIILINYHSLQADKARGLVEMIKICADLFGSKENILKNQDSIFLGITHLPAIPDEDESEDLEDLKKWIKETQLTDSFDKTVLEILSKRVFIYDPLNRTHLTFKNSWSRADLLSNLSKLATIEEPHHIFRTVLSAEDERGLRYICDEIKTKILAVFTEDALTEKEYKSIAEYQNSLNALQIIENPYSLLLIGEVRAIIIAELSKKIHRFEDCWSEFSPQLEEAPTILKNLKDGIAHFDSSIQTEVNIGALEQRLMKLLKRKEGTALALELLDAEKIFRDFCMNQMFVEAKLKFSNISEKVRFFDQEFFDTGILHHVKMEELQSLYDMTKSRHDETMRKENERRKELEQMEKNQQMQQRLIEEQNRREQELKQEVEKQRDIAKRADGERFIQEKKYQEQLRKETEFREKIARQEKLERKAEKSRLQQEEQLEKQRERVANLNSVTKKHPSSYQKELDKGAPEPSKFQKQIQAAVENNKRQKEIDALTAEVKQRLTNVNAQLESLQKKGVKYTPTELQMEFESIAQLTDKIKLMKEFYS